MPWLLTLGIIGVFSMAFVEYVLLVLAFALLMTSGVICIAWYVFLQLEDERKTAGSQGHTTVRKGCSRKKRGEVTYLPKYLRRRSWKESS